MVLKPAPVHAIWNISEEYVHIQPISSNIFSVTAWYFDSGFLSHNSPVCLIYLQICEQFFYVAL
jgi:hypothetical protein